MTTKGDKSYRFPTKGKSEFLLKAILSIIRGILFIIFFIAVSLLAVIFLKTQIYPTVVDRYEPTISANEVDNVSNTEIVEKLLTLYLEHYKAKPIFDDQRIKSYKNISARVAKGTASVAGRAAFIVSYEIQQHFWNEYWQLGGLEPPTPAEIQSVFVLTN